MSRIVSVWLPNWPIERLARRSPERVPTTAPFALVESGARGLRITAINASAHAAGVQVGSMLADARAALPALATAPAEARRDQAALDALSCWLGRYGPARNSDGSDGAWIDVTGVSHLFGGEPSLLTDLVDRLRSNGITARVAMADTFGAAHALARYATSPRAPWTLAESGELREPLARLPVHGLRLAPETVQLLQRLGLRRIADLYGLPRLSIERRFRDLRQPAGRAGSAAAAVLMRLDQALGTLAEPRRPLLEPPDASARLPFAEPLLSAEGVAVALERLTLDLTGRLDGLRLGGRCFRLSLYRVDGTVAEAMIGTSTPCRDPTHLRALFAEKLGAIDAGFGIDLMVLDVSRLEPLQERQAALLPGASACAHSVADLVDRLSNRLGSTRILYLEQTSSHIPERAQKSVPALLMNEAAARQPAASTLPAPGSRPTLLLDPPEPITVVAEIPDGAPARMLWRRVLRRIVRAEGPERIAPEWWLWPPEQALSAVGDARPDETAAAVSKRRPATRDYYRLEDAAGAGYWVFREGLYGCSEAGDADELSPRWFIQGLMA